VINEIVDAVKELSQNRIGFVDLETDGRLMSGIFQCLSEDAEISKELLQTIFSLRRCCMMERL